jgi:methylthioribose-1-phosphate isomerase
VVLAAMDRYRADPATWKAGIEVDLGRLNDARPTAVNLGWAIRRMRAAIASLDSTDPAACLLAEARQIHAEDIQANRQMGKLGAALIDGPCRVLTHCNAGALATGGYGTALGVIRSAYVQGKVTGVFADETRPWLQGARLTAWELLQDRIPVTLIADGAAAYAMQQGKVGWVVVGSDRIAANGDVANKIGTYALAVAARHHGVGFMVAAPASTVDLSVADGSAIPIESRAADEVLCLGERRLAPEGADAWNPVFDVTPASLIDAIVTERGVVRAPDARKMAAMMAGAA